MSLRSYKDAVDIKSKIATRITTLVDELASVNNSIIVPHLKTIRSDAGLAVDFDFSTITAAKIKTALVGISDEDADEITAALKAAQAIQTLLQTKLDSGELPPNTVN